MFLGIPLAGNIAFLILTPLQAAAHVPYKDQASQALQKVAHLHDA
jgi:hypothetical protein